jgi:thiol-disulfide isomerase/thioredoxin
LSAASQRKSPRIQRLARTFGRIGGVLVDPRATLRSVVQGGPGGLSDLLWLLGLQVVAVHLHRLLRAIWFMSVSYSAGVNALLETVAQGVVLPVTLALVGTVVLSLMARGRPATGRRLDLASLSVVPLVCLELLFTLVTGLGGWRAPRWLVLAGMAFGVLWFVSLLLVASAVARGAEQAHQEHQEEQPPPPALPTRSRVAGGTVGAILVGLLALNLAWTIGDWDSLRPVASGRPAPDFTLRRSTGGQVRLAELTAGHKVVLLSFWASWCGPCLKEMPMLARLEQELGQQGLAVLAINVEGDAEKVRRVRADSAAARRLTVLLDDGEVAERYGAHTLPHLVLVDRQGTVRHVHVGGGRLERLLQAVKRVVGD